MDSLLPFLQGLAPLQHVGLSRRTVDCRKRRVDAVVVYRYDRFARSLRQLVNALEEFRAMGIEFVSLHEGVDTSTPNGRLVFGTQTHAGIRRAHVCAGRA